MESDKHKVVFKDPGGKIIKIESVNDGESAEPPKGEDILKPGYEFVEWKGEFTNIKGDTEITAIYKKPNKTYNITVQNGTITSPEGSSLFEFDTLVTVTADQDDFSYWENSSGQIVSYDREYSFYVSGNETLIAVYSKDVQKIPVAAINGVIQGSGTVSFVAQCTVPEGGEFTIVEWGVVMSDTNNNPDLADQNVIRGRAGSKTGTGQFMITKAGTSGQWFGRAYIICRDGKGNLVTIYSDVKSGATQGN